LSISIYILYDYVNDFFIGEAGAQRALRKPEGLKPPDCDCWVGGVFPIPRSASMKMRLPSRLSFMNNYWRMGGLDRAKTKHLLKIFWPPPQYKKDFFIYDFCEGKDAECLAHFAAAQNAPNMKKPNRNFCITTKQAA